MTVDGSTLDPVGLLSRLNTTGGRHGVGRIDIVENRFVGIKSRGVYETPGGTILHHAHRAVESITLDREVAHLRDELVPRYAEMVYNGFWFSPEREALQAFMDQVQERVNGEARLSSTRERSPSRDVGRNDTTSMTGLRPPSRRTTSTTRPTPPASSVSTRCGCGVWRRSVSGKVSE